MRAAGQFVPAAAPADSDRVTDRILSVSFQGIVLTPAEQKLARQIIKRTFLDIFELSADGRLEKGRTLMDKRDALLLGLLRSAGDSARYLHNSEGLRPPRNRRQ